MADAEQSTFTHWEDLDIKQNKPNKTYNDQKIPILITLLIKRKCVTVFQRNVNYNEKRIYLPKHFYS